MSKASGAAVRRVNGGFIVSYKVPALVSAAWQQQALGLLSSSYVSAEEEVVCRDLPEVASVLTELLGEEAKAS